jgi:hypothetical protein
MAKSRKKAAAPEAPPAPQVGDKVKPYSSEMVYEISKVHHGGNEVDLHVPETNLQRFRPLRTSPSSNASLQPEPLTPSQIPNPSSTPARS